MKVFPRTSGRKRRAATVLAGQLVLPLELNDVEASPAPLPPVPDGMKCPVDASPAMRSQSAADVATAAMAVTADEPAPITEGIESEAMHSAQGLRRRIFPLSSAYNLLNDTDRAVYRALLLAGGCKDNGTTDLPSTEVQIGYAELIAAGAACKKSVQRAIKRLIELGYIERLGAATRASGERSSYRVDSPATVLHRLRQQGYQGWQQVGAGRRPVGVAPAEATSHIIPSPRRTPKFVVQKEGISDDQ